MSYVRLKSVKRLGWVSRGYRKCDRCKKRIPGKVAGDATAVYIHDGDVFGMVDIGPCCTAAFVKAMLNDGVVVRLRRASKRRVSRRRAAKGRSR